MEHLRPTEEGVNEVIGTKRRFRYDRLCKPREVEAGVALHADPVTAAAFPQGNTYYMVRREQQPEVEVTPVPAALAQMLSRIKVRAEFYNRCPPFLQTQIFNHFSRLETENKKDFLLRMDPGFDQNLQENAGKPHKVRAVLTSKYGIVDDHQLFPLVFEALSTQNVSLRSLRYDDHITQLVVDFPDTAVTHNGIQYVGGLVITNSETGHSSVWVEPVVNSPTYTFYNRASLQKQGVKCRFVHRGFGFNPEYISELRQLVNRAKDISQVGIVQLIESMEQTITKDHALAFAKGIDGLPRRFLDTLEEEWENQAEVIRAQAAQRILAIAAQLPLFQRIQVEQAVGQLVRVFDNFQSRMNDIMEELSESNGASTSIQT